MSGIDSYTKLMLHMDGADASTTFTDSSLSPKTVTRYGNAQIDTAQSKFGGASGLFDGTGDYLSVPDSDDWYFGTGDFTIDFWVRFNALPGAGVSAYIVNQRVDGYAAQQLAIVNTAGVYTIGYVVVAGGVVTITVSKTITPSTGTWYHFALVRTGNDFKVYQDGVQIGTTVTDDSEVQNIAAALDIGRWSGDGSYLNGHIDELRISKGIARWTNDFTPPTDPYGIINEFSIGDFSPTFSLDIIKQLIETTRTLILATQGITPFVSDANTLLLLHFDGTVGTSVFTDSSSYNRTMYSNGTTQIVTGGLSNQAVQTDVNEVLPLYYQVGTSLNFTDQNFTVEFCVKFSTVTNCYFMTADDQTVNEWISFQIYYADGVVYFYASYYDVGTESFIDLLLEYSYTFVADTYYHLALVRNGTTFTIYINGTSIGTTESSYVFADYVDTTTPVVFGTDGTDIFNGKMDEFRISNVARYTSSFTPIIEQGFEADFSLDIIKQLLQTTQTFEPEFNKTLSLDIIKQLIETTQTFNVGDFNKTFSLELERSFTGTYSIDLGDFNITSSFDFLRTLEKILTIGSFNATFTRTLSKVDSVAGFIQLVNHFLVGKGLKIKFNLNEINDIVGLLYLNNTIPDYQTVQNSLQLNNSIIVPINDSIEMLNKITSIIQGSLALKNKVSEKTEISSTISLINRIDPQQEVLDYFYLSEEHLG